MKLDFDVDIDLANRDLLLDKLPRYINASQEKDGDLTKHNSGVYLQNIPKYPIQNISTIPYDEAEERGYFKIDLLNNGIYNGIENETHLDKLLETEVNWSLFEHKEIVEQLAHISNHFAIIEKHPPESIEQLAMILAMIRPGKRYLVGNTWEVIEKEVWEKTDEYFFKKSHAIGYAVAIIVQLNLICEQANRSS